jgi:ankyrin repeat protein
VTRLFIIPVLLLGLSCDSRPALDKRLTEALKHGNLAYLEQYLKQGGDVNRVIQCSSGSARKVSAPLVGVAIPYGQLQAVNLLLKHGANPNSIDSLGDTPLIRSIASFDVSAGRSIQAEIVCKLLEAGADPNLKSKSTYGWTPLIWAAFTGNANVVHILLAGGADINEPNNEGQTAIHFAANGDVVSLLLLAGADPNVRRGGETPAETALRLGNFSAAKVLTNNTDRSNSYK